MSWCRRTTEISSPMLQRPQSSAALSPRTKSTDSGTRRFENQFHPRGTSQVVLRASSQLRVAVGRIKAFLWGFNRRRPFATGFRVASRHLSQDGARSGAGPKRMTKAALISSGVPTSVGSNPWRSGRRCHADRRESDRSTGHHRRESVPPRTAPPRSMRPCRE